MAIEGAVPDAPRGVVARAVAQQQFAAQPRREILDVRALEDDLLAVAGQRFDVRSGAVASAADANRRHGDRGNGGQRGRE